MTDNLVKLFPGGIIRLVKAGSGMIDGEMRTWGDSIQVQTQMSKFPGKLSGYAVLKIHQLIDDGDPDLLEWVEKCK